MLSRLVEFALAQRLVVLLVTALGVGAGIAAWRQLPIDAFPDICADPGQADPEGAGHDARGGRAARHHPDRDGMLGMPDAGALRSVAKYAIADITIDFSRTAPTSIGRASRWRNALPPCGATCRRASAAGWRRSPRRCRDMFMFTLDGDPAWPTSGAARLDRSGRRCAPCRAWPMSTCSAAGSKPSRWCPTCAALAAAGVDLADLAAALEAGNRNDGAGRAAATAKRR